MSDVSNRKRIFDESLIDDKNAPTFSLLVQRIAMKPVLIEFTRKRSIIFLGRGNELLTRAVISFLELLPVLIDWFPKGGELDFLSIRRNDKIDFAFLIKLNDSHRFELHEHLKLVQTSDKLFESLDRCRKPFVGVLSKRKQFFLIRQNILELKGSTVLLDLFNVNKYSMLVQTFNKWKFHWAFCFC